MNHWNLKTRNFSPERLAAHGPVRLLRPGPKRFAVQSRRGSVLILIVVMIAVLVIMGSAYLISVRFNRQAARSALEARRIEMVLETTIDQIRQELLKDLVNPENGQFFDPNAGIEPYDYPWTNPDATRQVVLSDGSTRNAAGGQNDDTWLASTVPNYNDQTRQIIWPHITNLTGLFLRLPAVNSSESEPEEDRVTNTGSNIENFDTSLPVHGASETLDDPIPNNKWQPLGADADGDGIRDSRWTWAPLRQIDDIQYVTAVRIIDNSSLLNINIACPLTRTGDGTDPSQDFAPPPDNPRGYWPTDLDLSRLFARSATYQSSAAPIPDNAQPLYAGYPGTSNPDPFDSDTFTWKNHFLGFPLQTNVTLPGLLTLRQITTLAADDIRVPLDQRRNIWQTHLAKARFQLSDEVEFRYRNGLNLLPEVPTELEKALPVLLRSWGLAQFSSQPEKTTESVYYQVANLPSSPLSSEPAGNPRYWLLRAWFHGWQLNNNQENINDRLFPDLRKFLTTWNGATAHAINYRGQIYQTRQEYKQSLNAAPDPATWAQIIFNVFKLHDNSNAGYLGYHVTSQEAELRALALQFALNLKDYIDADSTPSAGYIDTTSSNPFKTGVNPTGVTYFGLEPLPFLREVYIQMGYDDLDLLDAAGRSFGDPEYVPDDTGETWQANLDSVAIAIEIGNPFDKPITFSDPGGPGIAVRIRVEDGAGNPPRYFQIPAGKTLGARGSASSMFWFYANPSAPMSEAGIPRDNLLLIDTAFPYQSRGIGLPGTPNVDCFDLTSDPNFDQISSGDPLDVRTRITVSLELWVDDGTPNGRWVTYDRLTHPAFQLPGVISHNPWPEPPSFRPIHGQRSLRRDGRGAAFVTNTTDISHRPIGPDTDPYNTQAPQPGDLYDPDAYDAFGSDSKGVTSPLPAAFQFNIANRGMLSLAELGWVFMVGFNDDDNGDLPTVLSGEDGSGGLLALTQRADGSTWSGGVLQSPYLFLDFDTNAPIARDTGLPHAAMLLDQFTTLTSPWPNIHFMPGQININTVPLHLAVLAAPLPEPLDEIQNLLAAIADYRDQPKNRPNDSYATRREQLTALPQTLAQRLRQEPGITSLGELMLINPTAAASPIPNAAGAPAPPTPPDPVYDMQRYGRDGQSQHGTLLDLYSASNSTDNAEERMARFQFLSQVFTTRSDIFTAYILIRGYRKGQFNKDPVESARYIVIFDRSSVKSPNDPVKVLGVYRMQ